MANTNPKRNPTPHPTSTYQQLLLILTSIVSKIGIFGTSILAFIVFVFVFTTEDQKHELFDRWVLLKNNPYCEQLHYIIVIFSIIIISILAYTFSRVRKLDQEEINRLRIALDNVN